MTAKTIASPASEPEVGPVHISLNELPPINDLPSSVRELATTWQESLAAATQAGADWLVARAAAQAVSVQRQYARDRALARGEGDPGLGVEHDHEQAAREHQLAAGRRASHLGDDVARALLSVAPQALIDAQSDDREGQVEAAARALVLAVQHLSARSPSVGWWTRMLAAPINSQTSVAWSGGALIELDGTVMPVTRFADTLATIKAVPER